MSSSARPGPRNSPREVFVILLRGITGRPWTDIESYVTVGLTVHTGHIYKVRTILWLARAENEPEFVRISYITTAQRTQHPDTSFFTDTVLPFGFAAVIYRFYTRHVLSIQKSNIIWILGFMRGVARWSARSLQLHALLNLPSVHHAGSASHVYRGTLPSATVPWPMCHVPAALKKQVVRVVDPSVATHISRIGHGISSVLSPQK